jgi:hypothetical protein
MSKVINKVKEKFSRHKERHTPLGYKYIISDSIDFIRPEEWDSIANNQSIFLSRKYLKSIEECSPENTIQKYAIAYEARSPIAIIVCQLAEVSGERIIGLDNKLGSALSKQVKEKVLVCGNLVSSGLHGVAFSDNLQPEQGWKIVGEVLTKIRHNENITGKVDFSLIKDIKGGYLEQSKNVERYSYRKIQTDPDMVLELPESVKTFDDYLGLLNSKYRSKVKKVIKNVDSAGYECKSITIDSALDKTIHQLYLNVESKSKTRLATLPEGYFAKLSENLGKNFVCTAIYKDDTIVGFMSIIIDRLETMAYYVGFDYSVNEKIPVYFRLMQTVIEVAIDNNCNKISFGRSALEPKANLGAKPVETYVWARHNVSSVNFFLRKFFRNVPFDDAPERNVLKD